MEPRIFGMRTGLAGAMSYLYIMGSDAVIIDAGLGSHRLIELAKEKGAGVRAVLLTHCHFDHIVGIDDIHGVLPDLPIYVHTAEKNMLKNPDFNLSTLFGVRIGVETPVIPFCHGDTLSFGEVSFRVIHTPGHSLGSTCFFDGARLFSGDTLFYGSIGRADHFFGDTHQEVQSIKREILPLSRPTSVYPGHGEGTQVGFEADYNEFLR